MPKRDLFFRKPLLNAAGTLGFVPDMRAPVDWDALGAFITNPISRRSRSASTDPTLIEYPGGVLLHTGLPNPGLDSVLERYAPAWQAAALPIIVHSMADRPVETGAMVRSLESLDNVMGVELGFAPLLSDDIILLAVEKSRGEVPLIVCLPPDQVLRLGPRLIHEGADAISLAPPRGRLVRNGKEIAGRLFGPSEFPRTLDIVRAAAKIGLPTIGAGGVFSDLDARAIIAAGAIAVQVDIRLWLPKT